MTAYKSILVHFIGCLCLVVSAMAEGNTTRVIVKLDNLKAGQRLVYISVFNKAHGFPDEPQQAVLNTVVNVDVGAGNHFIELGELPMGEYAFTAYEDANRNRQLDCNLIGIPKEGVALSRRPVAFRMPRFNDHSVKVDGAKQVITLYFRYL